MMIHCGCWKIFLVRFNFNLTAEFTHDAKDFFQPGNGGGTRFDYLGLDFAGDRHVKSVAVNSTLLPSARIRTLERMGSVVRVLTTFWTACSPAIMWSLVIVSFHARYNILSSLKNSILIKGCEQAKQR